MPFLILHSQQCIKSKKWILPQYPNKCHPIFKPWIISSILIFFFFCSYNKISDMKQGNTTIKLNHQKEYWDHILFCLYIEIKSTEDSWLEMEMPNNYKEIAIPIAHVLNKWFNNKKTKNNNICCILKTKGNKIAIDCPI